MKIETQVAIEDGVAQFAIFHETHGVYRAELLCYNGRPDLTPPRRLLLMRGVRTWTGSCDRPELLLDLGQRIDDVVQNAPLFHKEEEREKNIDGTTPPEAF